MRIIVDRKNDRNDSPSERALPFSSPSFSSDLHSRSELQTSGSLSLSCSRHTTEMKQHGERISVERFPRDGINAKCAFEKHAVSRPRIATYRAFSITRILADPLDARRESFRPDRCRIRLEYFDNIREDTRNVNVVEANSGRKVGNAKPRVCADRRHTMHTMRQRRGNLCGIFLVTASMRIRARRDALLDDSASAEGQKRRKSKWGKSPSARSNASGDTDLAEARREISTEISRHAVE